MGKKENANNNDNDNDDGNEIKRKPRTIKVLMAEMRYGGMCERR